MTRRKSATRDAGLSTFLLEMALDRAQMKERLARFLVEERRRRGGGDASRFPQPEMAALLNIGLRQYQRWEDPEDRSFPYWRNLGEIADTLGVEITELIGMPGLRPEPPLSAVPDPQGEGAAGTSDDAAGVLADLRARLESLERREAESAEWQTRIEGMLAELVGRAREQSTAPRSGEADPS